MKGLDWRRVVAVLCLLSCVGFHGNLYAPHAYAEQGQDKDKGDMTGFSIDNQRIYEGMEKSYASGYVPKIKDRKAVVVLPLVTKRKISGNQITVRVAFGESEQQPFVRKNYEKAVSFGYHSTAEGSSVSGCYLVSFSLALKKDRYNGSYPVTLSVCAADEDGNEINQEFTVYVTITDGKESTGEGDPGLSDSANASVFTIDNKRAYEGMEKSYARGYVPKIEKEKAVVVLPLLSRHKLSGNRMTVTLTFGESESLPFVYKNYEKEVNLKKHATQGRGEASACYLAVFHLKLKRERYNGSYPVILSVRAQDEAGNETRQEFTVYVTITDGKEPAGDAGQGEGDQTPLFAPKVVIHSYEFSKDRVLCGEKCKAKLTLKNMSRGETVKNMLVSIVPGENVELLSKTGGSYVEELGSGDMRELSFAFRVNGAAPCGQYNIDVKMDYADSKGNPHTLEETMKVSAEQRVQMEISPVQVPKEIRLGETVELQTQAMNLGKGKLYNVRAIVEADGFLSSDAAFIGDMEAGTSMSGSVELTAEGFTGDSLYGTSKGKVTVYYEDEMGNELSQEQLFETSILSPLSGDRDDTPADDTRQWWIIMAVIIVFLGEAAVIFFMRKSRRVSIGDGEAE